MTDFVSNATPPLIPGDVLVRNATVNNSAQVVSKLVLPTFTTALRPSSTTSPIGTVILNVSTNQLNVVSTSHSWLSFASS